MSSLIKNLFLRYFFDVLYITGLGFLIPFVFSLKTPSKVMVFSGSTKFLFSVSIFLIFISLAGIYRQTKSIKKTFKRIGFKTFITGFIPLLILILGKELILQLSSGFIKNLNPIKPLVVKYLDRTVTGLWILSVIYIAFGIVLFFLGREK